MKLAINVILISICFYNCQFTSDLDSKQINDIDALEKEYLERYFMESLENNNTFKKNIEGFVNGRATTLRKILDGEEKIIVEYSPLSCGLCVDSLFTYLSKVELNKSLVVVTGTKNKSLVNFELKKHSIQALVIMRDLPFEAIEEINHDPKLYFLDSNMMINSYITVNKSMVKYLKTYIENMKTQKKL